MGSTLTTHNTLATELTIYDDDGGTWRKEQHDAPVSVYVHDNQPGAVIWLGTYRLGGEVRVELSGAERIALIEALGGQDKPVEPRHTVRGQTSDEGWAYGTTHDMDCPACVASGSSFLASPRSETYWAS